MGPENLTTDLFLKQMGTAFWPGSQTVGWALGCPPTPGWFTKKGPLFPGIRTNSLLLSGGQVGPPRVGAGGRPFSLGLVATSAVCSPTGGRDCPEHGEELQSQLSSYTLEGSTAPGLAKGWGQNIPLRMFSGASTKSLPLPLLLSSS